MENLTTADAPSFTHDDYTPKPGQAFTRAMAAAFVQRYERDVIAAVSSEIDAASKIEDRICEPVGAVYGVDNFLKWTMGKPFLRGGSDARVQAGEVVYLDKHDCIIRIPVYVEFDTERVYAHPPL